MRSIAQHAHVAGSLLLLGLFACSNRLDLGHDLKQTVTGRGPTDNTRKPPSTPDVPDGAAGAPDASIGSDAPDASTAPDASDPSDASSATDAAAGVSCVGIPCFAGPVLDLGTSEGGAKGLALDADNIYWAANTGKALLVTPKDGTATTAIPTPLGGPVSVAISDTSIYVTSPSGGYVAVSLKSMHGRISPKAPGPPYVLVSGEPAPQSIVIASDDGELYFSDGRAGTIKRLSTVADGGALESFARGFASGCELAVDSTSVYCADAAAGELYALNRATGADTRLATGLNHPLAPVTSGQYLYFLELGTEAASYADGRLRRIPRAGGQVETLLDHLDAPSALTADTAAVYLCTQGTDPKQNAGRILRVASDGHINVLAEGQATPFAIAVDGDGVYWTTDADNGLHAILR